MFRLWVCFLSIVVSRGLFDGFWVMVDDVLHLKWCENDGKVFGFKFFAILFRQLS